MSKDNYWPKTISHITMDIQSEFIFDREVNFTQAIGRKEVHGGTGAEGSERAAVTGTTSPHAYIYMV